MTTSLNWVFKKTVILSVFFLSSTSSAYAAFLAFFDGVTLTINQSVDHGKYYR